ncbi:MULTISPECIES: nicotinate-nucleotide--dimethylbenzimidazole phosphoribosyltransferase [Nocardiopsis]|uniref:Nicotinate-nucleotide--dimethylbenzimidazole phosphoribosyltransferase n=1 Tax=Nocardiopsis sinuspersici TaxID=501010 RepID=A0A1V3C2Z3_9ACTN|nr:MULTISPECIES: nicotinate-nucleotide--dimethylbenzimidazole phosphoribosyltransferase [Nocardiopsis]OOC55063.1 5,6-dimethylbenzimidazole synthase [Nocardiopsis sinuspersici]
MTKDDREDARRGEESGHEPPRWHGGRPAPGTGPRLGGLLDGLPESGRGTQAQTPGNGAPTNPFRQRPAPPRTAEPAEPVPPSPPPAPSEPSSPYGALPLEVPAVPWPQPEAASGARPETASASGARTEAPPRSGPAVDTPPQRPNVIPFRGGERASGPGTEAVHQAPPAPTPDRGTGHGEEPSATAEAEQKMYAHEAVQSPPEPQHTGPPVHPVPGPQAATAAAGTDAGWSDHAYGAAERAAVYRAIRERRDVRVGFRPDPVPHDVLTRVLEAAHQAPSVGHSQPWDFLVIDDPGLRGRVSDLAAAERDGYTQALPSTRARAFSGLKVEAILDAPLNIAVTVDPTRGGRHTLGRHAKPMAASHSAALAAENLWIAARAEGLGVGWVTFVDERDVARALELPSHLDVVAYLCVGYVEEFPTEPELSLSGWARGRPLSWAVHHDRYGRRGLPGQEPTSLLEETITTVGALNTRAVEEARDRQNRMTKPPGSLGVLEEVSVQLAGLAGECPPPIPEPAAVAVFAGDHGVHAQGVTAWPQEVTAQMVHNFLAGGAVVNAFASQVGAEVTVVDVGVVGDLPQTVGLLPRKVARGTADFTQGPALTRQQALQALEGGIEVARDLVSAGNRCLVTGDMGIANTTPAAALVCAFTGADPERATGRGTGVDDAMYAHKIDVVRRALAANPVDPDDPVGTLAALGGLEHAALAGFVLGGAALRVPVLLDGVIAGSAALAAAAMSPEVVGACFAGHRSSEPGHSLVLEHLGLRPLIDLEMRLGEGSGALLALPLLQGSARVLRDVATFDDAGVSAVH